MFAQLSYGVLYNWAEVPGTYATTKTSVEFNNVVMEIPFVVGGYQTFLDRLYVFAGAGPSFFFNAQSWWDVSPGDAPDYVADGGVGWALLAGADLLVARNFGVGLDVRYRGINSGDIREKDSDVTMTPAVIGRPGSDTYQFDFSGIAVSGGIRIVL